MSPSTTDTFTTQHSSGVRYCHELSRWFLWDGRRCDIGPRRSVRSSELYLEYHGWCVRAGLDPPTQTELGRQLTRRGFPARKRQGAMFRTGIDIHFDVLENA